jgi:arylsulfatase A-like enzyme
VGTQRRRWNHAKCGEPTTFGMAGRSSTRPPDILVVVLDCVRASDFPGGRDFAGRMPFATALRKESIAFLRSASVAPWTLPSHASLFTGIYPWEHNCHGRGTLRLNPNVPRLPSLLREKGYRTISVSGNPIISTNYGMTDGFDVAIWGEWWEQFYRILRSPPNTAVEADQDPARVSENLSRRNRWGRLLRTAGQRLPASLAGMNSVLRRVSNLDPPGIGAVNPWIEPSLRDWLRRWPRDRPVFAFVNLIDAHEPYLLDLFGPESFRSWWKDMRIPQDPLALFDRSEPPPREDLLRLHQLYQETIRSFDRRLERIHDVLVEANRWDNTLAIVTSDHGQCFGEHGMYWHGVRTDEEMLRVPLWVRPPDGELAGTEGVGWASPMDAMPTALEAAGIPDAARSSGFSLRQLARERRPAPLMAAGDGTEWNEPFCRRLTPARLAELNQFSIAVYTDDRKVVVPLPGGPVRYVNVGAYPPREEEPSADAVELLRPLVDAARAAGKELLEPLDGRPDRSVEDRLRSWGYE